MQQSINIPCPQVNSSKPVAAECGGQMMGQMDARPLHKPCSPYYATHTHPFNGSLSRTTRVSRYQKGKTNLSFTEARDSEWQWHQLGHMQVCTSLETDNDASTPALKFFTGWMPFMPPNQQRQSTEGKRCQK